MTKAKLLANASMIDASVGLDSLDIKTFMGLAYCLGLDIEQEAGGRPELTRQIRHLIKQRHNRNTKSHG